MPSKFIILTGSTKLLHNILAMRWKEFGSVSYYPSIRDELLRHDPVGHWRNCPYFHDLVKYREIDRDREVFALLGDSDRTVLLEEWHIGNLAWSGVEVATEEEVFQNRLLKPLYSMKSVSFQVWFVSDDLEKVAPGDEQIAYSSYLQNLSNVVKHLGLLMENIDGEAPPEFVIQRVSYLLTRS